MVQALHTYQVCIQCMRTEESLRTCLEATAVQIRHSNKRTCSAEPQRLFNPQPLDSLPYQPLPPPPPSLQQLRRRWTPRLQHLQHLPAHHRRLRNLASTGPHTRSRSVRRKLLLLLLAPGSGGSSHLLLLQLGHGRAVGRGPHLLSWGWYVALV